MPSPWLDIPLADYEGHMALPEVGQAQLLADLFEAVLLQHQPRSVAVLGCAGGNGFDRVVSSVTERVVGVDINPAYAMHLVVPEELQRLASLQGYELIAEQNWRFVTFTAPPLDCRVRYRAIAIIFTKIKRFAQRAQKLTKGELCGVRVDWHTSVSARRPRCTLLFRSWAMRIAVLTNGTRGDIQPYLSLGEELASRGHSVVLTVNKNLAAWAARSGLEIVSTEPDIEALFRPESTRRAVARGDTLTVVKTLVTALRASRREVIRGCIHAAEGADLIISTVLTVYLATAIAEHSRTPHAVATTMPLQPTRHWSNLGWPIRDFGVAPLNRLSHALVLDMGWKLARDDLREARALLGLPRLTRRPRWEALPSLQMYSPSLCARPSDWDAKHEITGACGLPRALRQRLGEGRVSEAFSGWLDAGPAPVFFGFGSMPIEDPSALLRAIAEVTRTRGLRALVGAGWTDYAARDLPPHVFLAPVFDYDAVLARCCAAVHHGGSGTTLASLRAGLPTLVTSMISDQLFWGWRVQRLGVGATLPFQKLNRRKLGRALDVLLSEPTQRRARELGAKLRAERGAERAADVVERWGREAGLPVPERGAASNLDAS